ncbi:uncharacterized protein I303_101511 [Kwoniella dejecticola CBS 10117]|uniref:Uncharacterized protein n=1 Tax=Kwoniella dejecticola CBS 10117 TaxID=1296121 RepID=A0AAJ8MD43_9TREE
MQHITKVPGVLNYDHVLSPAVRIGDTLYLSGQTPRDAGGKMLDGDIEILTEQCLHNLECVVKHAGGQGLQDIAKLTVFLHDLNDFPLVNQVFMRLLPDPKPARSCFQVARNPGDARVEIEGIAIAPSAH